MDGSRRVARVAAKPNAPTLVTVAPRSIAVVVGVATGTLLLLTFAYTARTVLAQLLAAIVLAMAAEPLVRAFERRGLGRGAAVGAAYALVAVALAGVAYLLVTPLVDETRRLIDDGPGLLQDLLDEDGRFGFLEERFHIVDHAGTALDSDHLAATAEPVRDVVGSVLHTTSAFISIAFLALFLQLGGRQWFESLVSLAPDGARDRLRRTGTGISTVVGGYVTGDLLISLICGTVTTAVLLATSVPYALALGVVVGLLDLIPLVGATIGTVIAVAVAFATRGVWAAAVVLAVMLIYQQIENNALQQLVYHRTVKISPLAIALSVAIGVQIGGVVGALLAIPVAGALKVVSGELVAWRRESGVTAETVSAPQRT